MTSKVSFHEATDTHLVASTDYSMAEIVRAMDHAKERHNSGNHLALGDDKLVARVHPGVMHAWCAKRGVTFSQLMTDQALTKQFLEDPDNSNFRIWKGKI